MVLRLRALLPVLLLWMAANKGIAQCSLNPALFLGNDSLVCEGHMLNAGLGYVSYLWHDGSSSQTFAADTSGWKYVSVTDSFGCSGTDSILLTVQQRPVATIYPPNDFLVCLGDTVILDAYSPTHYAYLWNDSLTSSDHTVTDSGSFYVIVFDSIGCTDTSATVHVNAAPKPIINLFPNGPYLFCDGDTLHLTCFNPGHYAYLWNDSVTSADRNIIMTGSYQVVVFDSTGCTDTSNVISVTFNPVPMPDLGPDTAFCTGDTIILDPGPGFSAYYWSTLASTQSIPVDSGDGYWVEVTDTNGCVGRDTVVITENPSPVVDLGADPTLCGGDSLTLDAGAGYSTYAWSTGDNTQTTVVSTSGIVFVQVTGANGCIGTSNMINVTADTTSDPTVTFMNLILSTGAYTTYQWFLDGSAITGANAQNYTPLVGGDYYVVVTTASGCTLMSDTLNVILEITPDMIPEGYSPNGDGVNDMFEIPGITAYPNSELTIFNRWGSQVWTAKPYTNNWNGANKGGSDLEEGTYFYTLDLGNGKDKFSGFIMIRR